MWTVVFLRLACLACIRSASGSPRGKLHIVDSGLTKRVFSQKQSAALAKLLLLSYGNSLGHGIGRERFNSHSRHLSLRLDADRCYYGELDAEGHVLASKRPRVERGTPLIPSPLNTPLEVVDAQFLAFSRDYDSRSIGDAFAHVSPKIVAQHNLDADKFKNILSGTQMQGMIGCDSWEVLGVSSPSDERTVVSLKVVPKPIPGCVKTSGVAGQGGITWPTYWKWGLGKVVDGPLAGCWMLEDMIPQAPPSKDVSSIDVNTQRTTDSDPALPVNVKKLVQKRPSEGNSVVA